MPTDKKISELTAASVINGADRSVLVNGDSDLNFTFTLLLQFLGANLNVGAVISAGTNTPANITGKNGDLFIKTNSNQFLQRISGTWTVIYTFPSDAADGTVLYGGGNPVSATGKNGDSYIDTATGKFYLKTAGTWNQVFSMASGPPGPRGNSVLNGTIDPLSGVGVNGDFYYNTTTQYMFGPKASGTWPAGVLIKGTNGKTILSGTVTPSNLTDGTDGDFYLDINDGLLYGPKAAGVWPAGVSIFGDYYSDTITRNAASANPIIIDNWQDDHAESLGNRPNILVIQVIADDGDGNPAEIDRNDIKPLRYYSDSPTNAVLTSIKIDTGDGATLSTKYKIKLNR